MGADRPLVTVITTCFNHEPYLDDYCRGLLAQTYEHVELVIFDDGSADDSWQKISDYIPALERKFTRVVAERHEHIGGPAEVLLAVGRAQGELMCFLDSDDYYLPEKLEENVRFMRSNPDAVAVHSDTDIIHRDGIERSHWRRKRTIPTGDVYVELLAGNFVMPCAFCCRTDLFRRYVPFEDYARHGYLAGDYARSLDLARHGPFGYIDRSLARYRVVEGSESNPRTREEQLRFLRSMYAMRLDYLDDPRVTPELAEQVERDYYWIRYQQGVELGRLADCEEG
ncbi:MAG: hypothetical protein QOI98_2155, partial [Solirubrobacteraceae bacterium]|nr:hypothetical protein [Solirubrobacteraceae bacterium]